MFDLNDRKSKDKSSEAMGKGRGRSVEGIGYRVYGIGVRV